MIILLDWKKIICNTLPVSVVSVTWIGSGNKILTTSGVRKSDAITNVEL